MNDDCNKMNIVFCNYVHEICIRMPSLDCFCIIMLDMWINQGHLSMVPQKQTLRKADFFVHSGKLRFMWLAQKDNWMLLNWSWQSYCCCCLARPAYRFTPYLTMDVQWSGFILELQRGLIFTGRPAVSSIGVASSPHPLLIRNIRDETES